MKRSQALCNRCLKTPISIPQKFERTTLEIAIEIRTVVDNDLYGLIRTLRNSVGGVALFESGLLNQFG